MLLLHSTEPHELVAHESDVAHESNFADERFLFDYNTQSDVQSIVCVKPSRNSVGVIPYRRKNCLLK